VDALDDVLRVISSLNEAVREIDRSDARALRRAFDLDDEKRLPTRAQRRSWSACAGLGHLSGNIELRRRHA
jgi:hypothetical protein